MMLQGQLHSFHRLIDMSGHRGQILGARIGDQGLGHTVHDGNFKAFTGFRRIQHLVQKLIHNHSIHAS